jgi:hypothetical protein
MSLDASARPGAPALSPSYTAVNSPGSGGALDESGYTDANTVTPLKSFPYIWRGANYTFFKGMPRSVDAALKAALIAAGLVS